MPVDLENVESKVGGDFGPIPDGIYPLRIFKGEEKPAQAEGKNDSHNFQLKVQFGEHEGRLVFGNFSLTEKMAPYLKRFYEVIGAKSFKSLDPSAFEGRPLKAEVITEEYNGKKTNKIRIGSYFEWNGEEATAFGIDGPAKTATTTGVKAPATAPATAKAGGKGSPFSNTAGKKATANGNPPAGTASAASDEPPF